MRLFSMLFALLFASSCIAQNYNEQWNEVEGFTKNGQPKSALEVIEKIHDWAFKEDNAPQLVKAVIHQIKFNAQFEEESLVASIVRLKNEAQKVQSPTKQILYSLLAEMYWGYFRNNSWRILKRTATTKEDGNILTWDFKRIAKEADRYYQLSLQDAETLRNAKLETYEAILTGDEKYRNLRPTLYHLLLERALDFYASEERQLVNFDRAGVYNDARLLGSRTQFLSWKIEEKQKLQPAKTTIRLFQNLLREAEKNTPDAVLIADLERQRFMHGKSQLSDKDNLYENTLQKLSKAHSNMPLQSEITYQIANLYYQQGSNASANDSLLQWKWKAAYQLCDVSSKAYPNTIGGRNCKALMQRISMRNFNMQAEKNVLPNAPFRFLLSYRNIGNATDSEWPVFVKIAQIDPLKYRIEAKRNYGEKRIKWLKKNSEEIAEIAFNISNPTDFREHSMELPLDALPVGTYVIFVGTDKEHSTKSQAVAYSVITVSDISLLKRNNPEGKTRLKIVSRSTGKPLKNARIELLSLVYDRKARTNDYHLQQTLTTDANGEAFYTSATQNYRGIMADVYHENDRLINADNLYNNSSKEDVRWSDQSHFFLDRAIYRPGQTIHFKGIILRSNGNTVEAVFDKNTTVKLFDANGQEVSSMQLKTNSFGTFSSTFIAPSAGLNGSIRIGNESGSHSFRMEEYKRPKFEIKMNRPTQQFRINDTVSVSGVAISYAGVPLDGAEVKYRVTRTARFPFRWLCWGWFPRSEPKQVAFGSATSNADGEFNIEFPAQPDPLVQSKYRPVFSYNLEVDVTDASGEMQTGNTTVSVGYHALNLGIELPPIIEQKELSEYTVSATNLSGQKQQVDVNVKVWSLHQNKHILRKRVWQKPDQFLLTEKEFRAKFPNDPYGDEGDFSTWKKDRKMLDTKFNTETVSTVSLEPLNTLPQGHYLVELSATDAFGTEVTQRAYFNMIGKNEQVPPTVTTAWFHALKDTYLPGEKLELLIGSSYNSVNFLVEVEVREKGFRTNRIIHTQTVAVSGSQKRIVIPITEAWRGNAQIHVSAVRNNELLSWSSTISVPYSNKELNVELETFRKEMTPDDAEEWTIKITDKDGKPVEAELLATMYDASLDVLAANNWGLQPYRFLQAKFSWKSSSFGRAQSQIWDRNWKKYPSSTVIRNFEKIDWFGYSFGRGYYFGAETTLGGIRKIRGVANMAFAEAGEIMLDEVQVSRDDANFIDGDVSVRKKAGNDSVSEPPKNIKIRSDFSETVFFHPHLKTDKKGKVKLKFNAPQSLTRWKFMALATTQDLKIGTVTEEVVTRKKLMITPNYPRFVREGDKLVFQVKVNVLDSTVKNVSASLQLQDGLTGEALKLKIGDLRLEIENSSATASWEIAIPEGIAAIKFTTKAWGKGLMHQAPTHTDGEEKTIAVLPNRMFVTESMPLPIRGKGTFDFTFEKLKNNQSSTLKNHAVTLEFTPNPIWLAVLSLPYMMEYPYECSEQIFSRYYANAIGSHLANSNPAIKRVFDQWKRDAQNGNSDAFVSELDKNSELKQILLTETPWVRDAQNETEQRRRIAELFDTERMDWELNIALKKLRQNQQVDGGWGWFNGMRSNFYITRYILSGFGKLRKMGVRKTDSETQEMLENAITFLDEEMAEYYPTRNLNKEKYTPTWVDLHTLYARSFYLQDFALKGKARTTYNAILKIISEKWTKLDASQKGLAAVILNRSGYENDAKKVMVSLRETALISEEFGTYWNMDKGYYWYQAPIENHVMILEAFHEVENDADMVREMNIWLLKQKQTQSWETTKATAEACYALLRMSGRGLMHQTLTESDKGLMHQTLTESDKGLTHQTLTKSDEGLTHQTLTKSDEGLMHQAPTTEALVSIKMGNETIDPRTDPDLKTEAGTGYFKTNWTKGSISPEMGNITVTKDNDGVAWGAVYWQYFENLDNITAATDNPIKLTREVMLLEDTENGQVMKPLGRGLMHQTLTVGDRVRVRIILETERHTEFVHLKDMRAASFEPREQLSGAQSQEGLYFYRSPTDAAMNFFFDYLPKGTFVFEYDLNVTQAGSFSNGISQVQCMYAPEFTTHSEGVRLEVNRNK